ncbi:MAG TPA: 6-phosphogluconolactonase [Bryobacteraceae bacterium]|jgi:6-phosphogluconolactonase
MNLHRFADAPAAAGGCAARILELLRSTLQERGEATLAISGGTSPKLMFGIFARAGFGWEKVHLFFVDERVVPPTDPQSNFKLANDTWLSLRDSPSPHVHRVQTELGAEEAARDYQAEIRRHFKLQNGELPRFDVIHRGMGPDSHTASLFPGEPLIKNRTGVAAAVWVEKMNQWRVSFLPGVLEAAHHTALLVTGVDKAPALKAVLQGAYDPLAHPSQIARDSSEWFVDKAAATELGS